MELAIFSDKLGYDVSKQLYSITRRREHSMEERGATMFKNGMRAVHPGEVLREDYLIPLKMSARALALALHVPAPRVNDIIRQRRGVTADTAMRLARYFGRDAR
jgi:addiction module HigA family antidote